MIMSEPLGNPMKQGTIRQQANSKSLTIANGAAVSSSWDVRGMGGRGFAVEIPVAWTAANIAFEVSDDDSTFLPVYRDVGSRVIIQGVATAEVGAYIAPPEAWLIGSYRFARLVSVDTSTGANTNQGAARTLKIRSLS